MTFIIPILIKSYVDSEKAQLEDWRTRMKAEAEASETPCNVMVCERGAGLPGGQFAEDYLESRHWWLKTSELESGQGKIGGGVPAQGDPQPATLDTQFNDHTGEFEHADFCTPVCSADEDLVEVAAEIGRPTGLWLIGVNDCNNQVIDALEEAGVPAADLPPAPFHYDAIHDLYKPTKDALVKEWQNDRASEEISDEDFMSDE